MSLDTALELIESVKGSKVLFIGDSIIDEYHYVMPLSKSPKENLIPVRHETIERFRGGVHAAAKHAKTFCGVVSVVTKGRATRKVRMVDRTYLRKLFEIHYAEGLMSGYVPDLGYFDVIVLADFGHGAVGSGEIRELCASSAYLAVSAQTNSANVGYNLITKYPRADYAVIDEPEARLAAADRDSPIEEVIEHLARGRFKKMIVTHGRFGAYGWSEETGFLKSLALTERVVDTMGAGDAFFAVTAPMAKAGTLEDLLLIGNAAGAMKTQIVGHRESIKKQDLIEYLKANAAG